jgi:acyl carrier protein
MENLQFVEDLAAVLEVEPEELQSDFAFTKDNWNSLAIVTTIVLIDEQFGVAVEGEKLRQCSTVGALWELIQSAAPTAH